jgi:hypothetical protein
VYNVTTIAHGLGYQFPSKILAWGLGHPLEIEVEVVRPGGSFGMRRTYLYGTTEYEVWIRVIFQGEIVTQTFRLDAAAVPKVEAFLKTVTKDTDAIKIISSFLLAEPAERKIKIRVEAKYE